MKTYWMIVYYSFIDTYMVQWLKVFSRREWAAVVVLTGFMVFITTPDWFVQLWFHPRDHVFIGVSHYFEDFFYYLDQFYQGSQGRFYTVNRFTAEQLPSSLVYFNHLILGRIGGLLGWESFTTYNISNIVLKAIFIMLSYIALLRVFPGRLRYRFSAFLIFLFTSSLPLLYWTQNGLEAYSPLRIFRANVTTIGRFGNIPNTHVVNILYVLLFIASGALVQMMERKHPIRRIFLFSTGIGMFFAYLALTEAVKAAVLLAALVATTVWRNRRKTFSWWKTCIMCCIPLIVPSIVVAGYMYTSLSADPVYSYANRWDVEQYFEQDQSINMYHYLMSFGPICLLFILGIPRLIRRNASFYENFSLILVLIAFTGYILPLIFHLPFPGFRVLNSPLYLFLAAGAAYGLELSPNRLSKKPFFILLTLYLLINLSSWPYLFSGKFSPLKEPDFHFTHLPDEVFEGFKFIRSLPGAPLVVLGSSDTSMDLMIPGLTGKRTYTGHFLITLRSEEKDALNRRFFYGPMEWQEAFAMVKNNNISYVMHTEYTNLKENLSIYYPFLETVFENGKIRVYKVNPAYGM